MYCLDHVLREHCRNLAVDATCAASRPASLPYLSSHLLPWEGTSGCSWSRQCQAGSIVRFQDHEGCWLTPSTAVDGVFDA